MSFYDYLNNPDAHWHSFWQPVQQRMNASFVNAGMQRASDALGAPYGSLAQQWNPSNYGSLQRQWAPQLFTPNQNGFSQADALAAKQRMKSIGGMQRFGSGGGSPGAAVMNNFEMQGVYNPQD